jgi:hypothetical protein
MKTTIKLTPTMRLVVQPAAKVGGISLEFTHGTTTTTSEAWHLTPDQAGALIFGMEQALETMQVKMANYGVAA